MSKRRDAKERSDDPEKHFEITGERLGKGAYGVVLKAKSKKTGKFAALKIMDIEKDDYEDLQLELKILAECDSPYLTAYYASFVFDNHFWIAMVLPTIFRSTRVKLCFDRNAQPPHLVCLAM
eukprot:673147-Amorphochlora_amoeboformis.AAC.1